MESLELEGLQLQTKDLAAQRLVLSVMVLDLESLALALRLIILILVRLSLPLTVLESLAAALMPMMAVAVMKLAVMTCHLPGVGGLAEGRALIGSSSSPHTRPVSQRPGAWMRFLKKRTPGVFASADSHQYS